MLDAILREHAGLASCAVHCRHCFIRFLTHPRNANRRDLHCPFGCREHRRRQLANERSKRHYQTDEGRRNKKLLNGKRSAAWRDEKPCPDAAPSEPASARSQDASCVHAAATHEDDTRTSPDRALPSTQADLEEASDVDVKLALDGFMLDAAKQQGKLARRERSDKMQVDPTLLERLYRECDGWMQRIHEKLVEEEGIQIGYSTLTRLLRELGLSRSQPTRCDRVPDEPGAEMQHDTTVYRVKLSEHQVKLIASLVYLRYSKRRYLKFYLVPAVYPDGPDCLFGDPALPVKDAA